MKRRIRQHSSPISLPGSLGAASASSLKRRRFVVSRGRRLLSMALRGRWGEHPWPDDWDNFWNAALKRQSSMGECPVCERQGIFLTHAGRSRQICSHCGSRARHRTMVLAVDRWRTEAGGDAFEQVLHLAPEPFLESWSQALGKRVITGDVDPAAYGSIHLALDLCALPFAAESFDALLASHVLEHIVDDASAIAECYRVLRPGGVAILPVPITAPETVDFGRVDPLRNHHARDCGPDYFSRYSQAGFEVGVLRSSELANAQPHALFTHSAENRVEHWIPFCTKPASPGAGLAQR